VNTFDPEAHTYHAGDRRLPSVTEVIGGLGLSRDWSFLKDREFYLQRGSAVHACIKLHLEGAEIGWDFDGAEHVRPRFDRFLQIAAGANLAPILSEVPLFSEAFNYAGTPDYFGPYARHRHAFLDFKGDAYERSHDLQLGGYRGLVLELAMRGELPGVTAEHVLYAPGFVIPLGGASPVEVPASEGADAALFRSAAALYNWKLSNLGGSR
jgi:hypothetical protein